MTAYWVMFLMPMIGALSPWRGDARLRQYALLLISTLFVVLIGFRHEVGGDWAPYLDHYKSAEGVSLTDYLVGRDVGYYFINWLSASFGGGIYFVNLICGVIIVAGTVVLCRRQPLPWVALLVAVPYLLIVTAMGYSRQGAALGFIMFAIVALADQRAYRFMFLVSVGATFHKSALLMIPLVFLGKAKNAFVTWLIALLFGGLLFLLLLAEHYSMIWQRYVESGMESEGGSIRVLMNAVPAVFILFFRETLLKDEERRVWVWIAVASLACVPLVNLASTAVDRMALYFMPMQLLVFSRIHRLVSGAQLKTAVVVGVILVYGAVLWFWLNFASNSSSWLPYQFAPFVWLGL